MRICRIVTIPYAITWHLASQIEATVEKGHQVFIVSSPGSGLDEIGKKIGATVHYIPIAREMSLLSDIRALARLYHYFRRMRFDIIHSMTPKAGFLTALAGLVARVPIRIHTFTGQPWAYRSGLIRWIAKFCDRLIVLCNTSCYTDSNSQRDFLVAEGIGKPNHLMVLGKGSLSGINLERFNATLWEKRRSDIFHELSVPSNAYIINFTGRIHLEKGIRELIEAFERLVDEGLNIYLLLVGPCAVERGSLTESLRKRIERNLRIRMIGHTVTPEKYYSVAHVLCIPSYREGFGSVVIEAGAMRVPAVGTRVVGLLDSIVDGKTGLLVPPEDSDSLMMALKLVLQDDSLRNRFAKEAERYAKEFDSKIINQYVCAEYSRLFHQNEMGLS